jgi:hypothetical protein
MLIKILLSLIFSDFPLNIFFQCNVEVFTPGTEKHRVYEMTPWTCHALGEEARRLRYCLRTCAPFEPSSASMHAICEMYVGTTLKAEGWEQSIDKQSMRVAGLSASMALKQLRSDVSCLFLGTHTM